MSRKKRSGDTAAGCGCLVVILMAIGAFAVHPAAGVGVIVFGAILVVAICGGDHRCDICDNVLERRTYEWTINGKKSKVCPHCNATMKRRQSKAATEALFNR